MQKISPMERGNQGMRMGVEMKGRLRGCFDKNEKKRNVNIESSGHHCCQSLPPQFFSGKGRSANAQVCGGAVRLPRKRYNCEEKSDRIRGQ